MYLPMFYPIPGSSRVRWGGWGRVVWCGVVWCGVVWCGVVWCGVVWCGVVRWGSSSHTRDCLPQQRVSGYHLWLRMRLCGCNHRKFSAPTRRTNTHAVRLLLVRTDPEDPHALNSTRPGTARLVVRNPRRGRRYFVCRRGAVPRRARPSVQWKLQSGRPRPLLRP